MNYTLLIDKMRVLPESKQQEILDFVDFLLARCTEKIPSPHPLAIGEWTEKGFSEFSMGQAMRGLEDEPVLYSIADIKERWN